MVKRLPALMQSNVLSGEGLLLLLHRGLVQ